MSFARHEPMDEDTFETIRHLYMSVHDVRFRDYVTPAQMKQACISYGLNPTQTDEIIQERKTRR
jgi:hypothetical protein